MTNILGVKGELKTLSKNQLNKLRADINEEQRAGEDVDWDRVTVGGCSQFETYTCDTKCPVPKTCDYIDYYQTNHDKRAEKVLQAIKEEFVRREKV